MKRYITAALLFLVLTINAQKTTFSEFYNDHKEQSKFSMDVPTSLANLIADDDSSEEFDRLIKKAKKCKIIVFNNEDNSIEKDFKRFTKSKGLKTLVKVRDGKDRVGVYYKEKGDLIKELILKANSKGDSFVMVGLKITLTKDELASLMSDIKKKEASH
ncbi:DUF4252 domain-containing protein [Tenacibaculum amylolyticum]|uniref:DUF4252 domain-containing protein n=1 Tax=Tenacibaculum amylolyticum TaxID=104269 RepID=UPI0038939BCA